MTTKPDKIPNCGYANETENCEGTARDANELRSECILIYDIRGFVNF